MHSTWSTRSVSSAGPAVTRRALLCTTVAALAAAPFPRAAANAARAARHRVDVRRLTFVPATAVVAPGDTVRWVNQDLVPHTLTAADGSWDSGHLDPNETWELRVTPGMSEQYFCHYHPTMRGQLRIGSEEMP